MAGPGHTTTSSPYTKPATHDSDGGLRLKASLARHLAPPGHPSGLRHYYADEETARIIQHNLAWARGEADHPQFQFAYLMLPTPCNLRCRGCFMGQDKKALPPHLSGPYFGDSELAELVGFLREHGAKALVYGGGGELFAWKGGLALVERVHSLGLPMVVFTNGSLLSADGLRRLRDLDTALIISLRDTVEALHNAAVGRATFAATLGTLEQALALGFQDDHRLAVEIPVTRDNQQRVLDEFLPAMRGLGVVPMVEEYIQIATSDDERRLTHTFAEARSFFKAACHRDASLGYTWRPEPFQRMIAQPQCKRPLYSFAVFPSRDVLDCPSHSVCYGNWRERSLREIIYSPRCRESLLSFSHCACSVFYTASNADIPDELPPYLETLDDRRVPRDPLLSSV